MRKGSGSQLDKKYPREYNIWAMMKQRCGNPKAANYINYGARGIKVCERWHRFSAFLEDMGPWPGPGYTLDRKDTHGDYTPENCQWADVETQQSNKTNNVKFPYKGQLLTAPQLARLAGIPTHRMAHRLKRMGLTAEQAMALPQQSWVQRPVRQLTLTGALVQEFGSLVKATDYAAAQQWPRTTRRKDGVVTNQKPLSWDGYKKRLHEALKSRRLLWGHYWEYAE